MVECESFKAKHQTSLINHLVKWFSSKLNNYKTNKNGCRIIKLNLLIEQINLNSSLTVGMLSLSSYHNEKNHTVRGRK